MLTERIAPKGMEIDDQALTEMLAELFEGRALRRVLLVPPDITRMHSCAGRIANLAWHMLGEKGCRVDVIPALGTHAPMTDEQIERMYGDIPKACFLTHNWREDTVRLGELDGAWLSSITEGLWDEPIAVEINRRVLDPEYDLILSIGQVVPHEVVGMANQAKNLFVGLGGSDMINKSHMMGAVYGLERMMGRDRTPVRQAFDRALSEFLSDRPIVFMLTVTSEEEGRTRLHGVFAGDTRLAFERAVELSQRENIFKLPGGIQTCVTYLDPSEYTSTWLGNKAIYRTRMAIRDGGRLIVLAPGVRRFGEDDAVDRLIRKYGYRGRLHTLELLRSGQCDDLRANLSAAAHMIHGSSDGRFTITYAVSRLTRAEVEGVGFEWADYEETAARYRPEALRPGCNTLPDGEEVYFIPNPALGLWMRADPDGR